MRKKPVKDSRTLNNKLHLGERARPNTNNAVIWYLGIRPCIRESLRLLYENFNYRHEYPVVVFSLGRQYSNNFQDSIKRDISETIQFIELPQPQVPDHIPEEELFIHRTDIPYVRQYFSSRSRIGYLHSLHFFAGEFINQPALQGFDWSLRLDDDAFIVKRLPGNLFETMVAKNARLADMRVQAQNYPRVLDCQIGLRELAQELQQKHKIDHGAWDSVCGFGAFTTYDMSMFREPLWQEWWQKINDSGGIYKYRWGDVEIHSLYLHMRHPRSVIHNFDFERLGFIAHGGYGTAYVNQRGQYETRPPLKDHAKNILVSAQKVLAEQFGGR